MAFTKAQLEAANNTELASEKPILASDHRSVNQKVIDQLYDAQALANAFNLLTTLSTPLANDSIFVIRDGVAYKMPASVLDFVQNFRDLSDVNIPTPVDGQVVYYNSVSSKFELKSINDIAGGVIFVANEASLPVTGTSDILYVTTSSTESTRFFYWNGSSYSKVNDSITNETDVRYFVQEDFISDTLEFNPSSNGTGAGSAYSTYGYNSTENALGVISIFTGTTSTGRCTAVLNSVSQGIAFGFGHNIRIRHRAAIEALSDATNTFTAYLGFIDNVGVGDQVDGCYFRYTHSINGGRWEAVNSSNNTRTAVDTTVAAGLTYSIFEIVINPTATSVSFNINGVTVLNTTNIPSGVSRLTKPGFKIEKSAGTTSAILDIDWYDILITRTTPR